MDMKKIIWLASYPKSGNTWFRVFLANLLSKKEAPVDINELYDTTIASNRQIFDETTGVNASDLSLSEIESLRPRVYETLAKESDEKLYFKIHDAFIYTKSDHPLVSELASFKALYILRNPLDVAVSFSHHLSVSVQKAIEIMEDESYAFCNRTDKLFNQLEQRLFSWSGHVKSWTTQQIVPVQVIRYEDMLYSTFETFSKGVEFIEIETEPDKIVKAIQNSNFNELQRQEKEHGFKERAYGTTSFFRQGKAGNWRQVLTQSQTERIIKVHGDIMMQYGYLDKSGNPLI